jgi:hypothetical protein
MQATIVKGCLISAICLALLVILALLFTPATVLAANLGSEHYRVRTATLADGRIIDEVVINGQPTPPLGYERATAELPEPNSEAGLNVLSDVPAFTWSFGCSATSAAMIAGYYDRTGYANMYAGPTNGGVMPLDNSVWPDWIDSHGDTRHQCPLSATHNGLDGRATKGHVDDYWIYYGQPGPDPWDGNWPQHMLGDCTGDFMRTNQWVNPTDGWNRDGSTVFYNYPDGTPVYDYQLASWGVPYTYDGGYGLKLFYESRGYTVDTMYNQYIYPYRGTAKGFTYAQYKAEIDAGRPVMIQLSGHTVVGFGYDDSSSNLMYIHDTWDYNTYTMTWGGSYAGMKHYGVTIVHLKALPEISSCDSGGAQQTFFQPGEGVYVQGSKFDPSTGYKIWIQDSPVSEGDTLVPGEDDSGSQETVTTTSTGTLSPTLAWAIPGDPFVHHDYDIIVDRQNDGSNTGKYNAASDGKVSIHVGMGGDVDCDAIITGMDVTKVFNAMYGGSVCNQWAADVDCDHIITGMDVTKVFNAMYGGALNCCND